MEQYTNDRRRRPKNTENDDFEESNNQGWDGIERRGMNNDRRQVQMPPPWYRQDYYPEVPYDYYPPIPPRVSVKESTDNKNITQSTLTLSQIGGIAIVIVSIFGSGINIWASMNKQIDEQKNSLENFKQQITKDLNNMDNGLTELKKINQSMHVENKQTFEQLEKRIQELDATMTQIYQKMRDK